MAVMSVQVREAQLRNSPSFLGSVVTNLPYGTRVVVSERSGDWNKVRSGPREGWIHQSALSEREIIINPGAADVNRAASSSEIALAGKGFSASVEAEYRRQNQNLNFNAVDRMQARVTTPEMLARFVREGGLGRV